MDYIESDSEDSIDAVTELPKNIIDENKMTTISKKSSLKTLEYGTKLDSLKSSSAAQWSSPKGLKIGNFSQANEMISTKKKIFLTSFKLMNNTSLKAFIAKEEPIVDPYSRSKEHLFREEISTGNKPLFKVNYL